LVVPKEKKIEEQSAPSTIEQSDEEKSESDSGFDDLDLPEVPKISVQPTSTITSVRETGPSVSVPPPPQEDNQRAFMEGTQPSQLSNIPIPFPDRPPLETPLSPREPKQFIPFMAPPSFPSAPIKTAEPTPKVQTFSSIQSDIEEELPEQKHDTSTSQNVTISTATFMSGPTNVDLQEVLEAAKEAAATAEQAAAAALAAADLVQHKINDFVSRSSTETAFGPQESLMHKNPVFDRQDSNSNPFSGELPTVDTELPFPKEPHVPQRLSSLEDDPYYSYPNLFSGGSGSGSGHFNFNKT
jgi:hypothetical protein